MALYSSSAVDVFFFFKTSLQLLQLFRRMLQRCFTVKLKKCFGDYVTSPDFPSAWRGEVITEFTVFG